MKYFSFFIGWCFFTAPVFAQVKDSVVAAIVQEENDNSQLQKLAHELFDVIGPGWWVRLKWNRLMIGLLPNTIVGA